ncbi:MAG: GNAT family N-acetyltransferase [Mixta calida]|uniref:N-acetyltransferase n=1 Tax=Mixta calida TaxID=665913 RepID=A0ABM6S0A5_9GAMM|nr:MULTISPECIES: GNAT family N-acetyltransferase [Mixta]AIX74056.1 acetyltransferase [Pantoea sp. PSNIH2]MBS6057784.1 GNAT family N-acetyltransferase [Pantoea sp.]POU43006.1 N-acetyltransferase [Pantoea sp. PSNIH5]POU61260.1 N-acetyltransferase [Pantoea sp. PSNIH4]POY66202.1 N-acetyltransferase [Pantoea sp. PSNIH3]
MDITISAAQPEHFADLRAIELAAFETLREAGAVTGQAVANSLEEFCVFSRDGLLLAAFAPDSQPVGFIAGKFQDIWLHIAEMDVHPHWQRRGIGRLLMQTLLSSAQQRGLAGATLTTDNIAAFNARFYARLGFEIVEGPSCPLHLIRQKAEEMERGFIPTRRVAMWLKFEG